MHPKYLACSCSVASVQDEVLGDSIEGMSDIILVRRFNTELTEPDGWKLYFYQSCNIFWEVLVKKKDNKQVLQNTKPTMGLIESGCY